jgi:molecular chaperone DnaJ
LEEAYHGTEIEVEINYQTGNRTLLCKIPKGIEDGTRIRIRSEGGHAADANGERGDLYLFVSIPGHPVFERDGADLFCRVSVDVVTATLGGTVAVPSPDGEIDLVIPEGTQTGRRFVLHGRGMPWLREAKRGDLTAELLVETPTNLSRAGRELMRRLSREIE